MRSARRDPRERGAAVLLALVTVLVLVTFGGLAVVTARRGVAPRSQRDAQVARRAAEAGAAAAIDWVARSCPGGGVLLPRPGEAAVPPPGVVGNGAPPGDSRAPLDGQLGASYTVWVVNDPGDPGGAADTNGILLVRSLGAAATGRQVALEARLRAAADCRVEVVGWREGT